jgi:uncharacterized protein YcfJ
MRSITISLAGAALALCAVTTGAMAQDARYAQTDAYCRNQAAGQAGQIQNQAANNQVGSTLLGAGLGAALGAAVGGGRGAAIGAASGAVVGTGAGAANAANADAYAQQTYSNTYWSCMSSYGYQPQAAPPPPGYGYGPR